MSMRSSSPRAYPIAVFLMGLALIASPLHGQDVPPGPEGDTSAESSVIVGTEALFPIGSVPQPDLQPTSPELLWAVDATAFELGQDRGLSRGTDVALMAVGATAVVVGLLLGGEAGTIVAVTGGVIGLVGVFRYVR
jgi:hypothetical protein